MRIEEIRKMTSAEIIAKVKELKKTLFDLRFKQATGQLENTAEIKKTRKTIARLETVLNEMKDAE